MLNEVLFFFMNLDDDFKHIYIVITKLYHKHVAHSFQNIFDDKTFKK